MFGVSGLRIDQLRRAGISRSGMWFAYGVWSILWLGAHAAGGAGIGFLMGFLGRLVPLQARAPWWILAALLALGGLHHLGLVRLWMPQLHRQVARKWMKRPLAWTALVYGFQLGSAVCTRITNFATYAALAAAFLSGSPGGGAVTMLVFGFFRALPAIVTGPMAHSPQRSFALAFRFSEWEPRIHRFSGVLLLICAAGLCVVAGNF
jgi:sulfite exporter TauE/SafE